MEYSIRFGKTTLTLDISPRRVVGRLGPKPVKEVPDVERAIRAALARPFESRPLADLLSGKRTALVLTVDHTRPSPRPMLDPIIEACENAKVEPTIMIAVGRHRQMTAAELTRHLGRRFLARHRVVQHDPFDERRMVSRGKTRRSTPIRVHAELFRHDVVLGCGIIEPSYLCGWSGGRKLLMPGIAHHASIDNNHFFLTHPDARIGRLHGNPVSDDAAEFAAKLPLDFIVYAVSGPHDEVAYLVLDSTPPSLPC